MNRYNELISSKPYLSSIYGGLELFQMFQIVFEEKNRMVSLGESIDNLLDQNSLNPELLTPKEIDIAYKKYVEQL